MSTDLFSAVVVLLLVLDPFGNVPLVVAALQDLPRARWMRVVLRECLLAYVILLLFMVGGKSFLELLQLSETSLSIAGGIVLFLIALRMVFPSPEGVFGHTEGGDPFLVPIAVPAIAGPSALATVMLLASHDPTRLPTLLAALTITMIITAGVLAAAGPLQRLLGARALIAVERLTGLLLTAIAVEMLLAGVRRFVAELAPLPVP